MIRISLLWILVTVFLVGSFVVWFRTTQAPPSTEFTFEVVDTEAAREQGLSGRASIPSNYGMLFVFPAKDRYGFWMKDMLVSIDILWLNEDGTILGIEESVSPSTYPTAFYPPEPVRYVLETQVGEWQRQGWSIGSVVPIPR
jgi:uncharacterized membrane protein (UPF0127 family)